MNKDSFVLSIQLSNINKDYSEEIILDKFGLYEDVKKYIKLLKGVYNKIKEFNET